MQLWQGRFSKAIDSKTNDFNSSIKFDSTMWKEDIAGSKAHAKMLHKCKIITDEDYYLIKNGLDSIEADILSGKLEFDWNSEDIHTFIEGELTARTQAGKRLHTARSRNDQVALDLRLYLLKQATLIKAELAELITTLCNIADGHRSSIMPGYTHSQAAQPITFGHHLMAYAHKFRRDYNRLEYYTSAQKYEGITTSPLGCCALAGTTYNIDRDFVAEQLGLSAVTGNSLDGVSDRDFVLELASILSIIMVHLSQISEEIVMWCSIQYKFIELDDAFSTGSSIMPQKKNPDIAELIRGKSGRVIGDLQALLTMMKGLPLAYNKDMQEDKEAIFDAVDTVNMCINIFIPLISTANINVDNMRAAAANGFINATDCADYLVYKGQAFRDAYKITGKIVAYCIEQNQTLESLTLEQYKKFSEIFEQDIFESINLEQCVNKRKAKGGPAAETVLADITEFREFLKKIKS